MKSSIWDPNVSRSYRDALRELVEQIDEGQGDQGSRKLLFLTYQLDFELFEEQVLPRLASSIDSGPLRDGARREGLERWLEQVETTVVYDANGLVNAHRRTSVVAAPVHMPLQGEGDRAVFHPKVVLYANGSDVGLLIGSANLTRSGIGSNIECIMALGRDGKHSIVRGQALRKPLAELVAYIEKKLLSTLDTNSTARKRLREWHSLLSQNLVGKAADGWGGVSFVWTAPGQPLAPGNALYEALGRYTEGYFFAPYFPTAKAALPLPLEMAATIPREEEATWLIPAPARDQTNGRHLSSDFYQVGVEHFGASCWRTYRPFVASGRFAHAKVSFFQTTRDQACLLLGSHNMTQAAWGTTKTDPKNVEASLLIRAEAETDPYSCEPEDDKDFPLLETGFESIAVEDESEIEVPMPFILVSANWQARQATIKGDLHPDHRWLLRTPWHAPDQQDGERELKPGPPLHCDGLVEESVDLSPLLKDTSFELVRYGPGDKQVAWRGMVLEEGIDERPRGFLSLHDLLEGLSVGDPIPPDDDPPIQPDDEPIQPDHKAGDQTRKGRSDPSGGTESLALWFDLFHSLRALRQRVLGKTDTEGRSKDQRLLKEAITLFCRELSATTDGHDMTLDDASLVRNWLVAKELGSMWDGRWKKTPMWDEFTTHMEMLTKLLTERAGDKRYLQWADALLAEAPKLETKAAKRATEAGR